MLYTYLSSFLQTNILIFDIKASPERQESLMLSTMPVTTNWSEPKLWSKTPLSLLMPHLSSNGEILQFVIYFGKYIFEV